MSQLKMLYQFTSTRLRNFFCVTVALLFCHKAASQNSIPQWERFEKTFESSVSYPNAPQEASLQAVFVSPSGETHRIYGFWDGGNAWRIRFAPNQAGKWTYKTTCSDQTNSGLHGDS